MLHHLNVPPTLYRFLEEDSHVEQFCAGTIWLSSLEICRKTESQGRKDAEEGTDTERIDVARGDQTPEGFRRSFDLRPDNLVYGSSYVQHVPDFHLLSFSMEFNPKEMNHKFGTSCVEVFDPMGFAYALTDHLIKHYDIKGGAMAPIFYGPRERPAGSPRPPLGFVKPRNYESEKEFRIRWWLNSGMAAGRLDRLIVDCPTCPAVSSFCRPMRAR